jgi:hypothetical protein
VNAIAETMHVVRVVVDIKDIAVAEAFGVQCSTTSSSSVATSSSRVVIAMVCICGLGW